MQVYFDGDFLSKGTGLPGRFQWAGWRFSYGGMRCFVPYLYHFANGLVMDILLLADAKKVCAYYKKNPSLADMPQNDEPNHPLAPLPLQKVSLMGRVCEDGLSYSFFRSVPWEVRPETPVLRRAYPGLLANQPFFACQRVCLTYTHRQKKRLANALPSFLKPWQPVLLPRKIKGLTLSLSPTTRFLPLQKQITAEAGKPIPPLAFVHPLTKKEHMLQLFNTKEETLSPTPYTPQMTALTAEYEVTPPLPKGAKLQFQSSVTLPREKNQTAFKPKASTVPIGIIGSADGPTVLIATSGKAPSGCVSIPSVGETSVHTFCLEGIRLPLRSAVEITLGKQVRP
jgi:hypothetical protein